MNTLVEVLREMFPDFFHTCICFAIILPLCVTAGGKLNMSAKERHSHKELKNVAESDE